MRLGPRHRAEVRTQDRVLLSLKGGVCKGHSTEPQIPSHQSWTGSRRLSGANQIGLGQVEKLQPRVGRIHPRLRRAGTRFSFTACTEDPPQPWPKGGWSLGTDRGLFQTVEVDVQVGVDAIGSAGQRDAVDQEYKQHEVRQRGRDPHHLAVGKVAVRARLCCQGGWRGVSQSHPPHTFLHTVRMLKAPPLGQAWGTPGQSGQTKAAPHEKVSTWGHRCQGSQGSEDADTLGAQRLLLYQLPALTSTLTFTPSFLPSLPLLFTFIQACPPKLTTQGGTWLGRKQNPWLLFIWGWI